jgi:hypothetical protein
MAVARFIQSYGERYIRSSQLAVQLRGELGTSPIIVDSAGSRPLPSKLFTCRRCRPLRLAFAVATAACTSVKAGAARDTTAAIADSQGAVVRDSVAASAPTATATAPAVSDTSPASTRSSPGSCRTSLANVTIRSSTFQPGSVPSDSSMRAAIASILEPVHAVVVKVDISPVIRTFRVQISDTATMSRVLAAIRQSPAVQGAEPDACSVRMERPE